MMMGGYDIKQYDSMIISLSVNKKSEWSQRIPSGRMAESSEFLRLRPMTPSIGMITPSHFRIKMASAAISAYWMKPTASVGSGSFCTKDMHQMTRKLGF